jgi:predicted metal-dependent hydrolase
MHPLLRFTLDLFGSNMPLAPVQKAPVAIDKREKTPPPTRPPRLRAPVSAPGSESSKGLFPANFHHPQANRQAHLGEVLVAYAFKRAQRRSIGFSVGPLGLAVRAPKWTPLHAVDAALQDKAAWILRKLHETSTRHAQQEAQVIDWRDGASMLYLGQPITLHLDPEQGFGAAAAQLIAVDAHGQGATPSASMRLHIGLTHSASAEQIRDAVQAWLMRQARALFQQRLEHFAPQLNVQWKKLSLSSARTRWGSARADGSIRLNWRLLHFEMRLIDYVVVHELSHLREMNHSPRFWGALAQVLPDYAALRRELKSKIAPHWG